MQAERWTTVDEEATRLSVHPETIRRWLKAGRIRGAKPGGHKLGWRIAPGEVERVLRGEPATTEDTGQGGGER